MNQTALITGASSGIGYELAKLFAKDHHNLVLVARGAAKLTQVADELQRQFGISAKAVPLDLTAALAPQFLFDQLRGEGIAVDILVNNAGYGVLGEFSKVSLDESLGQIQLNITALTQLTKLFLGPMIERRSGKIMNVASTAGFQPGPLMAVYYATKAYVISFSEAIGQRVKGIRRYRDLPLSRANGHQPPGTRKDGKHQACQSTSPHGCKDGRPRRLSRDDGRQDTGDLGISELAGGRVGAIQSAQAGDGGFAEAAG